MSPDPKPIDHLWAILKQKAEKRNPISKAELKGITCEEKQYISSQISAKLVSSMPRKLQYVISKKKSWAHKYTV